MLTFVVGDDIGQLSSMKFLVKSRWGKNEYVPKHIRYMFCNVLRSQHVYHMPFTLMMHTLKQSHYYVFECVINICIILSIIAPWVENAKALSINHGYVCTTHMKIMAKGHTTFQEWLIGWRVCNLTPPLVNPWNQNAMNHN